MSRTTTPQTKKKRTLNEAVAMAKAADTLTNVAKNSNENSNKPTFKHNLGRLSDTQMFNGLYEAPSPPLVFTEARQVCQDAFVAAALTYEYCGEQNFPCRPPSRPSSRQDAGLGRPTSWAQRH